MDRSKPDRARDDVQRGEALDQPAVKTVVVTLSRGGPQEWPYYRLSPRMKREWNAVEEIVDAVAQGKVLYSYGTIHADRIRSKYWVGKTGPRTAVGVTAVPSRSHLHEVLACSVHERFYFVVAHRDLSDVDALEVWRHIDACLPHTALVERHAHVHCAMVEMPNHECFEVIFRPEDGKNVTRAIQTVLAHSHLS